MTGCENRKLNMATSFTFTKAERLKSRKQIGLLFKNRQSVGVYPLRIFWAETAPCPTAAFPAKIAFSVSKKTFKQAVKRNRYKRLMREVYRLHKHKIYQQLRAETKSLDLMLIYVGKEQCDFATLEKKYLRLMDKLMAQVNS